jgi:type II secretory pathway pseudopilin PulG
MKPGGNNNFAGRRLLRRRGPFEAAFTMVEIAICLGIIAFAMVAIIGVLPTGLNVQRENREETVINRDGAYFLEAIRGGAQGIDELTNYVENIIITSKKYPFRPSDVATTERYTNGVAAGGQQRYIDGFQILGLLSRPKYELRDGILWSNSVVAQVRAINGRALDQSPSNDLAFRYSMLVEMVPFTNVPPVLTNDTWVNLDQTTNLAHNLYDLRLILRWPLYFHRGTNAFGRQRATFRALASGEINLTNRLNFDPPKVPFYFMHPAGFTSDLQ